MAERTDNVIAERMYEQFDEDRNNMFLINYFVEYRKTEQSPSLQDHQLMVNGKPYMKSSTADCKICVLWKDESTTCKKLSDLK